MDSTEVLLEERRDAVAIVTLNRPERLNALNPELMRRLVETVTRLADDDSARCIVLTGAGRGFCSGGDLRDIGKAAAQREAGPTSSAKTTVEHRARWLRRCADASRVLVEMPKPSIAMINGACAGAGLSLAAACDFRFASRSSKFVTAFTANGMPGDYGGSWLWTRILGPAKARQLYLIDEKRSAEQALTFGLIDRVYDDTELHEATLTMAQQLAGLAPSGVAYAKENLNAAISEPFVASLDRESRNMILARDALIARRKASA